MYRIGIITLHPTVRDVFQIKPQDITEILTPNFQTLTVLNRVGEACTHLYVYQSKCRNPRQ
jgi:hypothetical protein